MTPTNEQLREYATRVIRIAELAAKLTDYSELTPEERHCHECEMEIFRQWLSEHQADDGEPITPNDMYRYGFGDSARGKDEKRFEICPGVRVLFWACEGPKCWNGSIWIGANKNIDNPTRGDVRRLCAALGVPLKESMPQT